MNENHPENSLGKNPHARRYFLRECGLGLGKAALAGLLTGQFASNAFGNSNVGRGKAAENQRSTQEDSLASKTPHFQPTAKAVIHLFMAGAPSQLELFDPKPTLTELEGQPLPKSVIGDQRYAFIQPDAAVMGPRFSFKQYGDSGITLGEPLSPLGKVADELCVIKSVFTDQFNHAPAQSLFNTGFSQPGRPSIGSWALYGLGAETENLPAFVVMSTGGGISGGSSLWSSGFLPTVYSGVRLRNGKNPILNAGTPGKFSDEIQRDSYDLINRLNAKRLGEVADPEIASRIASFEMAAKLQTSAPELMDLSNESKETLELYGCDPAKPDFARACLLSRRMVERGVRFINIYHSGWDAHTDVEGNTRSNCKATAKASAALVADLKRLGLLDETLVVWGGEFGRTPMVESNPALGRLAGRDHHPQAFSMWMAGGGIQKGMTYGATDDFGFHITEKPVHVYDLQATILHTLGFDHERLTYRLAGRDFRLTDVHGKVVQDLL